MKRFPLHIALLLLLLALPARRAAAQPAGPATPIILEHADMIIGRVEGGEEVNDFVGNVAITQGATRIVADRAVLYRLANRAVFTGNVVITQPNMKMSTTHAEYDGLTKVASASNGVRLEESGAVMDAASGEYNLGLRTAYFRGGVRLRDTSATLKASYGEYYQDERRAQFHGGVTVESDSGLLVANDLTYWRDSREAYAVGNVVLTPKYYDARMSGDTLHDYPSRRYTLVVGHPRLVQIDTVDRVDSAGNVSRDTTVITARKMEAFRADRKEYVGTDSVRLRRGELTALAAFGRYLPDDEIIALGPGIRRAISDTSASSRDSLRPDSARGPAPGLPPGGSPSGGPPSGGTPPADSAARPDAVAGVTPVERSRVGSYPVIWYDKSQLTGDTVTVFLQKKKLRTIDVLGNGFAISKGKLEGRFDQLAGTRIIFQVREDTIRQVRSEGLASSINFMYDSDRPNGVNRTSGDTIDVGFEGGEASRIRVYGKRSPSEGEYFPEPNVAGQEGIYRLTGFVWIERDLTADTLGGSLPSASRPDQKGGSSKEEKKGNGGSSFGSRPR